MKSRINGSIALPLLLVLLTLALALYRRSDESCLTARLLADDAHAQSASMIAVAGLAQVLQDPSRPEDAALFEAQTEPWSVGRVTRRAQATLQQASALAPLLKLSPFQLTFSDCERSFGGRLQAATITNRASTVLSSSRTCFVDALRLGTAAAALRGNLDIGAMNDQFASGSLLNNTLLVVSGSLRIKQLSLNYPAVLLVGGDVSVEQLSGSLSSLLYIFSRSGAIQVRDGASTSRLELQSAREVYPPSARVAEPPQILPTNEFRLWGVDVTH